MAASMTAAEKKAHWQKIRYSDEFPKDIEPMRRIMTEYSKIPADEVDQHFRDIRDRAWALHPYPCIGRFAFLHLGLTKTKYYQEALRRLKEGAAAGPVPASPPEALLDLACCFGQVLRQFMVEGVPAQQLYGADLHPEFVDLGYALFRDSPATAPVTFVAGDLLSPMRPGPYDVLEAKVTMVHVANFFHLFGWDSQVTAAKRIVSFLRPPSARSGHSGDPGNPENSLAIFGGHIACTTAGNRSLLGSKDKRYLHTPASFQKLWDEVGEATGTQWRTVVDVLRNLKPGQEPGQEPDPEGELTYAQFGVYWA